MSFEITAFDIVASIAFVGQIINYTWFGYIRKHDLPMSNAHALLYTFVLCCFSFTEGIIAFERPFMWLYVGLNAYGIFHLWFFDLKNSKKEQVPNEHIHAG